MTQKEQVIEAMRNNGGYATFQTLNSTVDFSTWGTKTPQASIRGIVQSYKDFFRIQAGLWGLSEQKGEILKKLDIKDGDNKSLADFTHGYIQGIISEIGNKKHTIFILWRYICRIMFFVSNFGNNSLYITMCKIVCF